MFKKKWRFYNIKIINKFDLKNKYHLIALSISNSIKDI